MARLISLWKRWGMACDAVAMSGVAMVVCWGFIVLVWLCLWCIL